MSAGIGIRMREAVLDLVADDWAGVADLCRQCEISATNPRALITHRRTLWAALGGRFVDGSLVAVGVPAGGTKAERIDAAFLIAECQDFDRDVVELNGTRYEAVRVFAPEANAQDLPTSVGAAGEAKKRGPKPKISERVTAEMLHLLRAGKISADDLRDIKEEALEFQFKASRDTCRKARTAALSEFVGN